MVNSQYKKLEKIGYGGYGEVHQGLDCMTNETVVLKEIRFPNDMEGVPIPVIREISLLKEIEHSNIVRLLNVVNNEDENSVYLVFERNDLDLKKFLDTCSESAKDPRLIKSFLHQILRGVAYYHSHNILHLDLKPRNLLIDDKKNILKLADFGLARAFGVPFRTPIREEGCYNAPELQLTLLKKEKEPPLHSQRYSTSVDVWSVACIFAEMVTQQPLFPGGSELHQMAKIFSIMGTPTDKTWPGVTTLYERVRIFANCNPKELATVVPGLEPAGMDLLTKMPFLNPSENILQLMMHLSMHSTTSSPLKEYVQASSGFSWKNPWNSLSSPKIDSLYEVNIRVPTQEQASGLGSHKSILLI